MGKTRRPACGLDLCGIFLSVLLVLSTTPALRADQPDAPDRLNRKFLSHLAVNAGKVLVSPLKWQKDDLLAAAGASLAVLACLPADEAVHSWVLEEPGASRFSGARVFSGLGGPAVLMGLVSSGYLVGCLGRSRETRETFLLAAESLLLTEMIVQLSKTGLGRARPYAGEGAFSFHPFSFREKRHSFPSGHSAAAWALAAALDDRVDDRYVDALLYTFAAVVSLSRILLDKHFASDVVAGGLIGYFTGKKISRPFKVRASELSVSLLAAGPLVGLSISYSH